MGETRNYGTFSSQEISNFPTTYNKNKNYDQLRKRIQEVACVL